MMGNSRPAGLKPLVSIIRMAGKDSFFRPVGNAAPWLGRTFSGEIKFLKQLVSSGTVINLTGNLGRPAGKNAMPPAQECLNKTLELAELMLKLADEGDAVREDVGCGVLYGVLRDSAYRIKKLAEAERAAHIKKGGWEK
jgi:hypothetical protein